MIEREDLEVMSPEGVVDKPDELVLSAQGVALAKFTAAILEKHYSGWNWGIKVDERGGVVNIFAMRLSGDMGYTLYLDDLWNYGNFDWKIILMAGGEILERYGVPRKAFTPEMMGRVRTGPSGVPIPDVSDKQDALIKHLMNRRAMHGVEKESEPEFVTYVDSRNHAG